MDVTEEAGATNGDVENTTCTDRWKAAVANILKWIWKIYQESEIFLAVCCHRFNWI